MMTEAEVLKSIMNECISYKANFKSINYLMKLENNYYAAKSASYEDFEGCPMSYDVLEKAPELCDGAELDEYDCEICWRNAVKAKMNEGEQNV